ncbi:MAG: NAD(P)-dependent oxidoreductase [Burkholderiaceae bacterium]|nr:NAD(P)-dependent oxidoreductase [Burkholderiaceae bacterium]
MSETVAFVGLGAMGAPMAANLLDAGFALRVYNRTAHRAQALGDRGATVCATVAEAVHAARFVVSMVSDDIATRETLLAPGGVVANADPGTVILGSSSNTPAMARTVAAEARRRGLRYLDAPVSGSIAQARARELVFMVGGEAADLEAARKLLQAMGRMIVHVGASGAGATLKLINNMLSGTMIAALAEAVAVAQASGLDPVAVREVLCEGAAGSRLTRTKIPKMYARDFSAQFQLELMDKDLRYYLALASELDRPAPIGALVRNQLHAARLAGLGAFDTSVLLEHIDAQRRQGPKPEL